MRILRVKGAGLASLSEPFEIDLAEVVGLDLHECSGSSWESGVGSWELRLRFDLPAEGVEHPKNLVQLL